MSWHAETHRGTIDIGPDGSISTTITYRYNAQDASARPAWGLTGIGIDRYDPHPDDNRLLATGVSAVPLTEALGWFDVTYTFTNGTFDTGVVDALGGVPIQGSNPGDPQGPGSQDPTVVADPTQRTPRIKRTTNVRMVPFTVDYSVPPKTVQNSAGQPFEGLETEQITCVTNYFYFKNRTFDVTAKQLLYVNTINTAAFTIIAGESAYPARTVRCNKWDGELTYEAPGYWVMACEIEFEFNVNGWDREILDCGFYEKKNIGGGVYKLKKIIDTTSGHQLGAPVKLNGNGEPLPIGDPDVFITFKPYSVADWTNIFT